MMMMMMMCVCVCVFVVPFLGSLLMVAVVVVSLCCGGKKSVCSWTLRQSKNLAYKYKSINCKLSEGHCAITIVSTGILKLQAVATSWKLYFRYAAVGCFFHGARSRGIRNFKRWMSFSVLRHEDLTYGVRGGGTTCRTSVVRQSKMFCCL